MKTALLVIFVTSLELVKGGNTGTFCFFKKTNFKRISFTVVGGKEYLMKIVDRTMELLNDETSISGNGLPMKDFVGNFSG